MWVCQPARIRCRIDQNRHTVAVLRFVESLGDSIDIHRSVKSCLGETREDALRKLMLLVTKYIKIMIDNRPNLNLLVSDFDLEYSIEECEKGTFWAGPSIISYISMAKCV